MTISSANKFALYNGALTLLGARTLSSINEEQESRRLLDGVWDRGAVDNVLELGQWNFATVTAKLEYSASITPAFGFSRGFEKPSDLIKLTSLCSDEYLNSPLLAYHDGGGFWFTDLDEIYVQYVSNDSAYGTDFSLWPKTFVRVVEAFLAKSIVYKLTQNKTKKDDAEDEFGKLLSVAKSNDAMNSPTKFLPPGRLRMARNSGSSRGDRGSRSQLLG